MRSSPRHVVLAVMFASAAAIAVPASAQTSCPDPATLTAGSTLPMAAVRYLADDALEGRRAGSDGAHCAGEYIASEFRRLGLRPAGDNATYFQDVPLASALNPHGPGGTGRNVIAALPGTDPSLAHEWIVVGAHYDHLGQGGMGSLAPGERAIHNGADDNASGVGAMLGVAERLAAGPAAARGVVFIAFTGEEEGLLGSAYFASHPTIDGRLAAMINMDMVGRLGDGPLIVYGVDTAEEWNAIVEPAARRAGVDIAVRGEGYGPSDHTSFYIKDVPVLHFFTNVHADYHRPSDDWEKIDTAGLATVTGLVTDITRAVADRRQALTLRRGAGEPPPPPGQAPSGYGAYLGSVPDFTPVERGVRLSGVTPGAPADAGGIRAGDVIVKLGEHDVADLQGLTDALRAHKPGDTVVVEVLRDGRTVKATVTLGDRASR